VGNAAGQHTQALQLLGLLELAFHLMSIFLGLFPRADILGNSVDDQLIIVSYPPD
jgi:hypothetical protein